MGRTIYVTVTVREYADLQRIVGLAHASVRQVPSMYQPEVRELRRAVDEYEARTYSAPWREDSSPLSETAA